MTVFQEMVVESLILPNQYHMILVSFFSEGNVLSDESKCAIFSNFKVTKIERSAFLGHPVYRTIAYCLGDGSFKLAYIKIYTVLQCEDATRPE